jgi:2-oxoglutarate ferredoxin oxidoreductase subunit alpha
VLIMTDAEVGHMTEKVIIPPADEVDIYDRPLVRKGQVSPDHFRIYRDVSPDAANGPVSPMAVAGEGYRIHVTGLTHDERGYPAMNAEAQEWNLQRLFKKIRDHRDDIIQIEESGMEDADVVVVAYGISARTASWPIEMARREGLRVGFIRLITVWPFPEERIRDLARRVKGFVVPEINMGQIVREVERCAGGHARTLGVNRPGGDILEPESVLAAIRKAAAPDAGNENK